MFGYLIYFIVFYCLREHDRWCINVYITTYFSIPLFLFLFSFFLLFPLIFHGNIIIVIFIAVINLFSTVIMAKSNALVEVSNFMANGTQAGILNYIHIIYLLKWLTRIISYNLCKFPTCPNPTAFTVSSTHFICTTPHIISGMIRWLRLISKLSSEK